MEWIECDEKLPEDLINVLLTNKKDVYKGYVMKSSLDGHISWYTINDFIIDDVTHWMPLPKMPK